MNKSKRVFRASEYGSALEASYAAGAYARQFSKPWAHRSNGTPLLWANFDSVAGGFVVTPNLDFWPNRAWNDLLAYEQG